MADDEEFLQKTMRIDIPPDLPELAEPAKAGPEAARPGGRIVIRIPKDGARKSTFGDPDFQELFQNIYDAALITTPQGHIIAANVRAIQFFGFKEQEFNARNILQLISGAGGDLLATIRQTLENDRFVLIQACCNRKDGSFFAAEISVNRLRLSAQEYLSFFVRDVTLRKEAEERLRTGDTAIRNSGSGIAVADIEANLQYCNPAMLRLWGLAQPEEAGGRNIREFLADPAAADEMISAAEKGESWTHELQMRRQDGSSFFVQVSLAPNIKPDGDLAGFVLSSLDITNLKQAQLQLRAYADELREKNTQMQEDLNMAREVQDAFLPRDYPSFPRALPLADSALRFSHLYHPSGAVGGDFFDILPLSDTQAGIFIADVVGHGMRAALIVATTRGLIEQLAPVAGNPGKFLTELNRAYTSIFSFRDISESLFATAFYAVIDLKSGTVHCANAGHPPPFRLRRDNGTLELFHFEKPFRGPALGLFTNAKYESTQCSLGVNDLLFLYTDGLSETVNPAGEYYDAAQLPAVLAREIRSDPAQLLEHVMDDARAFSHHEIFDDDVCLLAVEVAKLLKE